MTTRSIPCGPILTPQSLEQNSNECLKFDIPITKTAIRSSSGSVLSSTNNQGMRKQIFIGEAIR